jgi:hypothetical protein
MRDLLARLARRPPRPAPTRPCAALGIYVEWRPDDATWHVWTRWLNWPSRSKQEGPLWVHGTLNIENEVQGDRGAALAEAIDIARSQAEGAGAVWDDPAVIVKNPELAEDLHQEIARQAARLGWPVRQA